MTAIHILLVEDNPGDARLVQLQLREVSSPISMVHVDHLATAIERLASERFDAVLLDLSLPDSAGMNTVSKLLAKAPQVAVVVLTGLADEATGQAAIAAGAQDYLVKGRYDSDLLRRSLLYAIERKATRRRLDMILSSLGEGVIGVDAQGTVTFMNDAARVLSGWDGSRLIGKDLFDAFKPERGEGGAFARAEWSVPGTLVDGDVRRDAEALMTRADGGKLPIEAIVTPIEENGRIAGAVFAFHDITDRQQAFAVLRRQIAFQHQLLDNLPNPVFYADRTLTLIGCNGRFANLRGEVKEALLGHSLDEFLPHETLAEWKGDWLRGRIGQPAHMAPLALTDAAGRTRNFMLETVVFADHDGALGGLIGTLLSADDLQGS